MDDFELHIPPILTLPPEITAEIFSHYVDKPHDISWKGGGPLILSRVCRSWREISLSTCSLWASVMLINDQCNWDEEINLRFLQRWISRAGSRPLDPCLIPSTFSGPLSTLNIPRYSKQISKLLPMLLSYSSQWRSLDITLYPSTPFTSDTYTRLVSLVKLTATMLLPQVPFIMTTFRDAPALREVSLASLGPLQSILLPWIQLTHLNLAKISVPKSLEILKQTPNLEVLDIFPQPSASPSCELTIAHLHTFTFRGCHYTLLDRLTLPSLRTLQLYGLRSDGVPRLLEMGIRSSWSPRAISLDTMGQETSTLCLRNSKKSRYFSLLLTLEAESISPS